MSAYRLHVNVRKKDELSLLFGRSASKVIETDLEPVVRVGVKLVICSYQAQPQLHGGTLAEKRDETDIYRKVL